jgi:hypothetical protein
MKIKIILMLSIIAFCFSCKKNEEAESNEVLEIFEPFSPSPHSIATGIKTTGSGKNGVIKMSCWGARSREQYDQFNNKAFGISMTTSIVYPDSVWDYRDIVSVGNIPLKKGSYPILISLTPPPGDNRVLGSYVRWWNDDQWAASYHRDPDKNSIIELTEVDTVANRVKGKLNVYFVKKHVYCQCFPFLPEKVSFTSMEFDTEIIWQK